MRAYYLGFLSLLPLIGTFIAIFVILQARRALMAFREDPEIKGKGHAMTGLIFAIMGLLINSLFWLGLFVMFFGEQTDPGAVVRFIDLTRAS